MGSSSDFTCAHCDLTLRGLTGSPDRGFFAVVETRHCPRCRHIADEEIGEMVPGPDGEERFQRYPPPRCTECGTPTRPWNRTCPRCGRFMKRGETTIMWD